MSISATVGSVSAEFLESFVDPRYLVGDRRLSADGWLHLRG
jgi:hypothetical protein